MASALPATNWAGNVRFRAARQHLPETVGELRHIIATRDHVRILGTGHSFSPLADTPADQVSVAGLPRHLTIAADRRSVTVSAGMRHGEIATRLHEAGLALHNLASLPHISVAGAVATGTHGSGIGNGNLATAVIDIEMVTADGDLAWLSRAHDAERFPGAVVALGCLGAVTSLTLEVEPTYDVRQTVYESLPFGRIDRDLDEILAAGYSVSLFTTWRESSIDRVWIKRRVDQPAPELPATWMDAHRSAREWHPIAQLDPAACTAQMDVPGPWHERLPHFRLEYTPSSGSELQTEYLLPRRRAADALRAVETIRQHLTPVLQISEIRTVAADDLWLSPSYARDSLALHFTWVDDVDAVAPVVARLETVLEPFAPRPHWAKISSVPADVVASRYPRMADFQGLRHALDPHGVFSHPMIEALDFAPHEVPEM